jgi:hypothetical protein
MKKGTFVGCPLEDVGIDYLPGSGGRMSLTFPEESSVKDVPSRPGKASSLYAALWYWPKALEMSFETASVRGVFSSDETALIFSATSCGVLSVLVVSLTQLWMALFIACGRQC